jgi:uncharacterized protein (DUF433 family)
LFSSSLFRSSRPEHFTLCHGRAEIRIICIRHNQHPQNGHCITFFECELLSRPAARYHISSRMIDWRNCPDVESVPGKCSGAWCVKGTRVMVQCLLDNADDFTAEEIATEIYDLPVDVVRRILAYAGYGAPGEI